MKIAIKPSFFIGAFSQLIKEFFAIYNTIHQANPISTIKSDNVLFRHFLFEPYGFQFSTYHSATSHNNPIIATAITASSIAVGVTDGAKFTLQSQILTGDISYTCNSNTATFTVNKASNGLELPSGDAPGNISNRLYNENGVLNFLGKTKII